MKTCENCESRKFCAAIDWCKNKGERLSGESPAGSGASTCYAESGANKEEGEAEARSEEICAVTPEEARREALRKRLLKRVAKREAHLLKLALEAEKEGDDEGVWFAMASRAENNRLREQLESDEPDSVALEAIVSHESKDNPEA